MNTNYMYVIATNYMNPSKAHAFRLPKNWFNMDLQGDVLSVLVKHSNTHIATIVHTILPIMPYMSLTQGWSSVEKNWQIGVGRDKEQAMKKWLEFACQAETQTQFDWVNFP